MFKPIDVMAKNEKILFTVDDFNVIEGHSYIVKHKVDSNAPSGLRQEGVTKVPTAGAGDTFQCPYVYDPNDTSSGVWDSGMTEYSPIYGSESAATAKSLATALYKSIGEPYESSIGKRGIMKDLANQDAFWTGLDFTVEAEDLLKTTSPKDCLTLYYALRQRVLTPPNSNGLSDPKYSGSAFRIVDITNNKKVKDERAEDEFNAIGDLMVMLKSNKTMLMPILKWIGIRPSKTAENAVIISMFKDHITPPNTSASRIKEFNQLIEDSGSDIGRNKLLVYDKLDEVSFKNKISKNGNGALVYAGLEIGLDLKSAAANIASKPEFQEIMQNLIIGENS